MRSNYKGRTIEDIFEVGQLYYPSSTTWWRTNADDAYLAMNLREAFKTRKRDERFQSYAEAGLSRIGRPAGFWNPYDTEVMLILSREKISSPALARHDGSPRYAYKVLHNEKIKYISALSGAKKVV